MNLTMLSVEQKLDRERDTHTQYKKRSSALVHIALKHTFPGSEKRKGRKRKNNLHSTVECLLLELRIKSYGTSHVSSCFSSFVQEIMKQYGMNVLSLTSVLLR